MGRKGTDDKRGGRTHRNKAIDMDYDTSEEKEDDADEDDMEGDSEEGEIVSELAELGASADLPNKRSVRPLRAAALRALFQLNSTAIL